MIGRLNHVAIVVPNLASSSDLYREAFGAQVSEAIDQPLHGVTTVFVSLPNSKIELLHPLGDSSPIARFLERNPSGGIHHICYEVKDIIAARDHLLGCGLRLAGEAEPVEGAHGKPVIFLHPKDFDGTLIELEEV